MDPARHNNYPGHNTLYLVSSQVAYNQFNMRQNFVVVHSAFAANDDNTSSSEEEVFCLSDPDSEDEGWGDAGPESEGKGPTEKGGQVTSKCYPGYAVSERQGKHTALKYFKKMTEKMMRLTEDIIARTL